MQSFQNRFRAKNGAPKGNTGGDYRVIAWAGVPEAGRIHSVGRDITEEHAARRERERSWTLSPVIKVIATVDARGQSGMDQAARVDGGGFGWSACQRIRRSGGA
jgi:hypothetical protein